MSSHAHSSLPWLDRLAMRVPGHPGYSFRQNRREADLALRHAIARRLDDAIGFLQAARKRCLHEEATTEAAALERLVLRIRDVIQRVQDASSGVDSFYVSKDLRASKADALHALDHELLEEADEFADHCEGFGLPGKDWESQVAKKLDDFEKRMDYRAHYHVLMSD